MARDDGVKRIVVEWVGNLIEIVDDIGIGIRAPIYSDRSWKLRAATAKVEYRKPLRENYPLGTFDESAPALAEK